MSTDREKQDAAFRRLLARYRVQLDGKGEVWVACPNCEREDKKFSFSVRGFKCFVCGFSGVSLPYLAHFVDAPRAFVPYRHMEEKKAAPVVMEWQREPWRYLEQFKGYAHKGKAWRRYRPFTDEIIERYELGVGVLPACRCHHPRLIYPAYEGSQIVGFRGRAIGCDCPKWIVSKGTKVVLWASDYLPFVEPGCTFLVSESPVDGMMAKMVQPGIVTVASTGGAGTWREEWTETICALLPERVITWLDNDLPGGATGKMRQQLLAEWYAKMEEKGRRVSRPPVANGARITNGFLAHGARATMYRWPEDAPAKMDLSDVLMKGL